jgi:hypothetical protein
MAGASVADEPRAPLLHAEYKFRRQRAVHAARPWWLVEIEPGARMLERWSVRRLPAALALAASLCCGCDGPPYETMAEQVEDRLVGTWLREYEEGATRVRRVLVLEPTGSFQEAATVSRAGAPAIEHSHEGQWTFDGTNLKRRYTLVDGRRPAAPMVPFATLQLAFPSRHEFVGTDNLRRREVRYRRVADGTLP